MRTFKSREGVSFSVPDDATSEQIQVAGRRAVDTWNQRSKQAPTSSPAAPNPLEEFMGPAPASGPLGSRAAVAAQEPAASPLDFLIGMNPMEQAATIAPAVGGARIGAVGLAKVAPSLGTIGGALGSLLGEYGAQKTGLVPESNVGLALSALPIPASAAVRRGAQTLPGAAKGIRAAAGPLYEAGEQAAKRAGVEIAPRETAKVAGKHAAEVEGVEFATAGMRSLAKKGERVGEKIGIPYAQFRDEMQALGKRIGQLGRTRGAEYGQAKDLYKAMTTDLNEALKAAPADVARTLRQAMKLTKRAEGSEKIARRATQWPSRMALGAGGFAGAGAPGTAAIFAPDIIRYGLETKAGTAIIKQAAGKGATIDEIANALVQAVEGVAQEYTPPWEMTR